MRADMLMCVRREDRGARPDPVELYERRARGHGRLRAELWVPERRDGEVEGERGAGQARREEEGTRVLSSTVFCSRLIESRAGLRGAAGEQRGRGRPARLRRGGQGQSGMSPSSPATRFYFAHIDATADRRRRDEEARRAPLRRRRREALRGPQLHGRPRARGRHRRPAVREPRLA